jgi:hypothetical protein
MTLATLVHSSPENDRIEAAVRLLSQAMVQLHRAQREEIEARERAALDAQRAEQARRAEAETRRRSRSVVLDRGWAEKFGDALREVAREVGRRGERAHANQLGNLIDALRAELENPERASR